MFHVKHNIMAIISLAFTLALLVFLFLGYLKTRKAINDYKRITHLETFGGDVEKMDKIKSRSIESVKGFRRKK